MKPSQSSTTSASPDAGTRSVEPIIDPERPIIDSHHHLWPGTEYFHERPYELAELRGDLESGHNIVATVFVEASANYSETGPVEFRSVNETRHAAEVGLEAERLNLRTRMCLGVVSHADLRVPHIGEVLDAHMAAAPGRMQGVRMVSMWEPRLREMFQSPPQLLMEPEFRRGFAELGARGLSFDACPYHFQLPHVASLARAFPETTIILDHIGGVAGAGPYEGRRQQAVQEWRPLLAEVAACSNVVVKVGGQGMWISGLDFDDLPVSSEQLAEACHDVFSYTIDQFGPDRCMFESNFPVDGRVSSYAILWNALKLIGRRYSESEQQAMFHDCAARIYRLAIP